MKLKLDKTKCIGCGLCATVDPNIFEMDYQVGKAKIKKQPDEISQDTQQVIDTCPVKAISYEDE